MALVVAAGALAVVLELLDDELELLPQAVNTTASTVNIPIGTTFFNQVLPRIRCLLFICFSMEL